MAATLLSRFLTYQSERFPLLAYVPLLGVATFGAVSFSFAARAAEAPAARLTDEAFPWLPWLAGLFTVLVFFFFLRALDEHKDAPEDARFRPELPVPRGLVSLRELRRVAVVLLVVVVALNAWVEPALLVFVATVLAWAGFMGREFFVRDWLRARPAWYLVSHMLVMPLIFLYATALDWLVAGASPPPGTPAFLALAFLNGLVIEVGRKVRPPAEERVGVDSYTRAWGTRRAAAVWIVTVVAAATALALLIARHLAAPPPEAALPGAVATPGVGGWLGADSGLTTAALAAALLIALATAVPGILVLVRSRRARASLVEAAAGLWVLASYGLIAAHAWLGAIAP